MKNIKKIVSLYNLIHNRRSITTKTIKQVCNISDRTLYRYLIAFSEANIPIFFDYEIKAYRLNQEYNLNISHLSLDEKMLILIGLKYLSDSVNDIYKQKIEDLIIKIISLQGHNLEDNIRLVDRYIPSLKNTEDNSNFISLVLLNTAIQSNKKVRIMKTNDTEDSIATIDNPTIHFNGDWYLANKVNLENDKILSEINIVNIY